MNIYLDFDEVIVDLISAWVEWMKNEGFINQKTKKPYIASEIDSFFIFNDIGEQEVINPKTGIKKTLSCMEFLNDKYLYHSLEEAQKIDPTYTRNFSDIKIKEDAIAFFKILQENNLMGNVKIITASAPITSWSKYVFIEKKLPFLETKNIITTSNKAIINDIINFSIIVDDGEHNVLSMTAKNDFIRAFVLNAHHNQEIETIETNENGAGKRIFRINSLNEDGFFSKLIYAAVQDINKKLSKNKEEILAQEQPLLYSYIEKNQKMKDLENQENIQKEMFKGMFSGGISVRQIIKMFPVEKDLINRTYDEFKQDKKNIEIEGRRKIEDRKEIEINSPHK